MQKASKKCLEVFLEGGVAVQVEDSFENLLFLLESDALQPEDFIYLKYKDGCRAAFRKKSVMAISEYDD